MSAKEMFEELGYKQEKFDLEMFDKKKIPYLRYSDNCCYKTVSFQLKDKFFSTSCITEDYEKVLKAINKQIEELNWNK